MAESIKAIRGMNDILPEEIVYWQLLESTMGSVLRQYGYDEIRLPIVESTHLFKRSIGEVTDIVEKEMYTFDDRNGDSLTLRPEGTAGCVRAGIEHSLFYGKTQRLYYLGPMFRHERPQKGRYRQFYQLGVEAVGMTGPDIDLELILLCRRIFAELQLLDGLELQLNSLGTLEERQHYRDLLVVYFKQNEAALDEDSKRRLESNPLRILDSKNPDMRALIDDAPKLMEHLSAESQAHFTQLCEMLDVFGVEYVINPTLVRGLDYYSLTVFEWVTSELGAQNTVCAGGHYDKLISQLGGKPNCAMGFAMGLERIILLLQEKLQLAPVVDLYFVAIGEAETLMAMRVAELLRDAIPELKIMVNCDGGSFKSQFKRADKSGAQFALIIGDQEMEQQVVAVKALRGQTDEQQTFGVEELIEFLQEYYSHE